jgi:hypothetical protein
MAPSQRVATLTERSWARVIQLGSWLRKRHARVSKNTDAGKVIDYSLKRWTGLIRCLDDGRLRMTNKMPLPSA